MFSSNLNEFKISHVYVNLGFSQFKPKSSDIKRKKLILHIKAKDVFLSTLNLKIFFKKHIFSLKLCFHQL